MKFLVDAHLPGEICTFLRAAGHDAIHTRDLPSGNLTTDAAINDISVADSCVVISKDSDFYYSHILHGRPWKLVLIRTGNIRVRELIDLFQVHLPSITDALGENTLIELDRAQIRVLR